ncbi:MAG: hypothetical protein HC874_07260 [Richelia sp. SL_2_1]|nr:hypothetical protein [Richelia sp. SM1_7_0]NJO27364.1 hypothetical protein [Richelia sp. SL_2_1]
MVSSKISTNQQPTTNNYQPSTNKQETKMINPTLAAFAVERAPPATFYKRVTLLTGVTTTNNNHCTHSINHSIAGENND